MRKNVSSSSPFEESMGFSRASRIGYFIAVAGTAPINPDGSTAYVSDVYQQTKYCLCEVLEIHLWGPSGQAP